MYVYMYSGRGEDTHLEDFQAKVGTQAGDDKVDCREEERRRGGGGELKLCTRYRHR